MAHSSPTPFSSLLLSLLLFAITLSCTQIFFDELSNSEIGTIIAGFICSLLFVFGFIFFANISQLFFGSNNVGWVVTILSIFIATLVGSSIHRVTASTTFIFSLLELFWLNKVQPYIR